MPIEDYGRDNILRTSVELGSNATVIIEGSRNVIEIAEHCHFHSLTIHIVGSHHQIHIGTAVTAKNLYINITDNHTSLTIGENTTFEDTSITIAERGNVVSIGKDCMFAMNTQIIASDFHSITDVESGLRQNSAKCGVIIGNHVWVAMGAKILKDTVIEHDSIIGAASLVTIDVPVNTVAGGVPAKIIRQGINWSRSNMVDTESSSQTAIPASVILREGGLEFYIERVSRSADAATIYLDGWAFLRGTDSRKSEIALGFQIDDKELVFWTDVFPRQDVADAYDSPLYTLSGFRVALPSEIVAQIKSGRIIVQNASDHAQYSELSRVDLRKLGGEG